MTSPFTRERESSGCVTVPLCLPVLRLYCLCVCHDGRTHLPVSYSPVGRGVGGAVENDRSCGE